MSGISGMKPGTMNALHFIGLDASSRNSQQIEGSCQLNHPWKGWKGEFGRARPRDSGTEDWWPYFRLVNCSYPGEFDSRQVWNLSRELASAS